METSQLPTIHSVLEYWAEKRPKSIFARFGNEMLTMADLNSQSNKLANSLTKKGVRRHDMVGVMMQGSLQYLIVWFALSKLGATEVPINTAYKGHLLEHVLKTTEASTVILDPEFEHVLEEAGKNIECKFSFIFNSVEARNSLQIMIEEGVDSKLDTPVTIQDIACVLFTSGTTGPSKGVLMSHGHQLSFGRYFNEIVSMTPDDVTYNYLPFFHIAAKFLTLGTLLAGAKMAMIPVFRLSRFWSDVQEFEATVCIAVGGLCHMLRGLPVSEDDNKNSLRLIYAVPRPSEFLDEFQDRFGLVVAEGYGSTETNLVVYSKGNNAPVGSCGQASPHFDVKILDEHGEEAAVGKSGEICVRPCVPNTIMSGYLAMPEKSLEAFKGLWLHTGDRGFVDQNGYFFFQDRMNDAMRRRGENISSFEVERMINEHPDVSESAVVAVPSELDEDEVLAVIVPRENKKLDAIELLYFFYDLMPYFMVPRYMRFVSSLPRTPTQKVRKVELRGEGVTDDTWDSVLAGFKVTREGILSEERKSSTD